MGGSERGKPNELSLNVYDVWLGIPWNTADDSAANMTDDAVKDAPADEQQTVYQKYYGSRDYSQEARSPDLKNITKGSCNCAANIPWEIRWAMCQCVPMCRNVFQCVFGTLGCSAHSGTLGFLNVFAMCTSANAFRNVLFADFAMCSKHIGFQCASNVPPMCIQCVSMCFQCGSGRTLRILYTPTF